MKKLFLFIVGIGIFGAAFFLFVLHNRPQVTAQSCHIAICTPISHPALEEVEQGFKETLEKGLNKPCTFTTFNANGNKTLMRAQAEDAVAGHYDLIFTMGASFSQAVAELLHKKSIDTPQVFGSVDEQSFAQALTQINKHTTGVYVHLNYERNIDILLQVKPTMHTMLLVYDPMHGAGLEKEKKIIEQYAATKGVTVQAVEIYQPNEIQQKVAALIPSYDVVMVLVDNTVVSGIDTLITLCNRYGVTLYASDLNSGKKGAALTYGITEYTSGSGAARKALEILVDHKKPEQLPISAINQCILELNRDVAAKQNIDNSLAESIIKGMQ